MNFGVHEPEEATLGLTPLIDVVLLMLVFFVVTMSFAEARLELELPEAEAATAGSAPQAALVEIAADGAVFLDGEPVEEGALRDALARIAPRPGGLELRADRNVSHGRVVEALDAATHHHLTPLTLRVAN